MGHKKWKYKIIYPEYRKCDEGMDIRIRPLKLYDENGFAPQYRLNEGKHSWDGISAFTSQLEADLLHMKAEFKEKAKELRRENRQKERVKGGDPENDDGYTKNKKYVEKNQIPSL